MTKADKPLVWLKGEINTPPFSAPARIEAGVLLRRLQRGESISLPHSRPMPGIGRHAMNCEYRTAAVHGASFIALTSQPS